MISAVGASERRGTPVVLALVILLSSCSGPSRSATESPTTTTARSTSTTEPGSLIPLRATGLAVGPDGDLYVADLTRNQILERHADGTFTVVAGTGEAGSSGDGGLATDADLSLASDFTFSPAGDLYVADGDRVRLIDQEGVIHTIAGSGRPASPVTSGTPALSASLAGPVSIAFSPGGVLYMATSNRFRGVPSQLLRMTSKGTLQTVRAVVATGPGVGNPLGGIGSIAVDSQGNVYAASVFAGWSVYKIDTTGKAKLLGYARRSGGSTTDVERGPDDVIEVDNGPEILRVQRTALVPEFDFENAAGLVHFTFVDCFAIAPDGTLYADNLSGPFDPYQQIVSVTDGHATSLWRGLPSGGAGA
jgi:plastocyanin